MKVVRSYFNSWDVPRLLKYARIHTLKEKFAEQLKAISGPQQLESVYASMIKTNANQNCFLMNQFISVCSSFYCMDYATFAFTQMQSPNVFVYNAIIRGFVHCGYPYSALEYYIHMLRDEVMPTSYTFSSLIKACASFLSELFGRAVHAHVWRSGFVSHIYVQTSLIDFYSNCCDVNGARLVFDGMLERDVFAWTTMISVHAQNLDMNSARSLFDEMPGKNIATWNTMIDGYARSGNIKLAELLFNQMPSRDIISWTTMITCYCQNKKFTEAVALFNDMRTNGITPDAVTMATAISAFAHLGSLDLAKEVHLYISINGFLLDVYIGSALVDMYAKCGSLDKSLLVFFKLPKKNLFCWNSIIEGLAFHGFAKEALRMFNKMEKETIKPNEVTFISLLSACTHAGLVEEARHTFLNMIHKYSIHPRIEHYGCMVDLLSKAGLIEEALEMIRNMELEPNSIIWGALLSGCKLHRNFDIAQVAADSLMVLEPHNSGYRNLLVNMYAEANRWSEVAKIRKTMLDQGVEKTYPGFSCVEEESKMHQFAASDKSHLS